MSAPLDVDYFIGQIDKYNLWLCQLPLPHEYREQTTYGQLYELMGAKMQELGLTDEVISLLNQVKGNDALDWAWTEVGMTEDNREMTCSDYERDLPLDYHWMPEYEPMRNALYAYWDTEPQEGVDHDVALREIVEKHRPKK